MARVALVLLMLAVAPGVAFDLVALDVTGVDDVTVDDFPKFAAEVEELIDAGSSKESDISNTSNGTNATTQGGDGQNATDTSNDRDNRNTSDTSQAGNVSNVSEIVNTSNASNTSGNKTQTSNATASGQANACKSGKDSRGDACPADDTEGPCPPGCDPDEKAADEPGCTPVTLNDLGYMCPVRGVKAPSNYTVANLGSSGLTCSQGDVQAPNQGPESADVTVDCSSVGQGYIISCFTFASVGKVAGKCESCQTSMEDGNCVAYLPESIGNRCINQTKCSISFNSPETGSCTARLETQDETAEEHLQTSTGSKPSRQKLEWDTCSPPTKVRIIAYCVAPPAPKAATSNSSSNSTKSSSSGEGRSANSSDTGGDGASSRQNATSSGNSNNSTGASSGGDGRANSSDTGGDGASSRHNATSSGNSNNSTGASSEGDGRSDASSSNNTASGSGVTEAFLLNYES